jgi:hypothetical protein
MKNEDKKNGLDPLHLVFGIWHRLANVRLCGYG